MKRLFWDLECGRTKKDNESWDQYKVDCGVSIACVVDDETGEPTFYTPHDRDGYDLHALIAALESADEVVSFNGDRFDSVVLANSLTPPAPPLRIAKSVDLLRAILDSKGPVRYPDGSWSLNNLCLRTMGIGKVLNDGAFAPQKAAQGRWGELVTYCHRDVVLTKRLWEFVVGYGFVIDPDGRKMEVRLGG